jgi:hypothetical protein
VSLEELGGVGENLFERARGPAPDTLGDLCVLNCGDAGLFQSGDVSKPTNRARPPGTGSLV